MQTLLMFLVLAAPAYADQNDFKMCIMGKFSSAKDECPPDLKDCTPACKSALESAVGTMDGSCCDQLGVPEAQKEQCVHMVTAQLAPMIRAKIEQQCGSGFDAASVLESLTEIPLFAKEKTSPTPETSDKLGVAIVAFFSAVVGGIVSAGLLLVALRRQGGEVAPYEAM